MLNLYWTIMVNNDIVASCVEYVIWQDFFSRNGKKIIAWQLLNKD